MVQPLPPLVQLVLKYEPLLTRFALRLTAGNIRLANTIVKHAMEDAYDEDVFYDTPQLRNILKDKIVAKAKLCASPLPLN